MKRLVLAISTLLLVTSCITPSVMSPALNNFVIDSPTREAGMRLAEAYLEGQKNGDDPYESKKYGRVPSFHNLADYRCVDYWDTNEFRNWGGYPTIHCQVKAANAFGGFKWQGTIIVFDQDPDAYSGEYKGLRIKDVILPKGW